MRYITAGCVCVWGGGGARPPHYIITSNLGKIYLSLEFSIDRNTFPLSFVFFVFVGPPILELRHTGPL